MKISELISLLEERLESCGDQEVEVYDTDYELPYPLEVEYTKFGIVFKPE